MRRALVTGAAGMLGSEVVRALRRDWEVLEADLADFDITDEDTTAEAVHRTSPEVIVNCAAYTDVDGAESHPETAHAVNGAGAGSLSRAARSVGAFILHVSTDYVFDGTKEGPYTEDDEPDPIGVYGESKLRGEREVLASGAQSLIVRTAWLYGHGGANFVETVLRLSESGEPLRIVDDQRGSPTNARDLALVLRDLAGGGARGLLNATNAGSASWYDFAVEILRASGRADAPVEPVSTAEFPRPAPRPRSSVLSLDRLSEVLGWTPRPWEEALAEYLSER
ncbi:MAG: dTDP-4-dehydrorhamnose reductase [Candidatus Eisenbacteria bacterium]